MDKKTDKILFQPKEGTSGFFKINRLFKMTRRQRIKLPQHLRQAPDDSYSHPNAFLSWLSVIGIKTLFFVVGIGERLKIF